MDKIVMLLKRVGYLKLAFVLCSLIVQPATAEVGQNLVMSGPNQMYPGNCVQIMVTRTGDLTLPLTVQLSGWDSNLSLFQSGCGTGFLAPNGYLSLASSQASAILYAMAVANPNPGLLPLTENLKASDPSNIYSSGSLAIVLPPESLSFSGPTQVFPGSCVQVKLNRNGDLTRSLSTQISGWDSNLTVFQNGCGMNYLAPNGYVNFAVNQASLTLFVMAVPNPNTGLLPLTENLKASDPSNIYSSGTLAIVLPPESLSFSGPTQVFPGSCVQVKLNRNGDLTRSLSTQISGWDSNLTVFQNGCGMNYLAPNGYVNFAVNQASLTLFVMAVPNPNTGLLPLTENLKASDPSNIYSSGTLAMSIAPQGFTLSGPSQIYAGSCVQVKLNRNGDLSNSTQVQLSGWDQNLVVFQTACGVGAIAPNGYASFTQTQASMTLYVLAAPIPSTLLPLGELIKVSDVAHLYSSASFSLSIQPSALKFSGASQVSPGTCVQVTLTRNGDLTLPTTVQLSGWDYNLAVFQTGCSTGFISPNASLGFALNQATMTLYVIGTPNPVSQTLPLSENIKAADTSGRYSSASEAITVTAK